MVLQSSGTSGAGVELPSRGRFLCKREIAVDCGITTVWGFTYQQSTAAAAVSTAAAPALQLHRQHTSSGCCLKFSDSAA